MQVTEEGTLAARGKNAAVGAAVGAGGALVISKASTAIKAAVGKIGAATKASKKPAAILNQYNLRPRTSSPNYVSGSTKSTARTSASKPGLPLTQYENVKIVNSHTTTHPSHNASNANAQAALNKRYARNYFNVSNQSHYDLHRIITSKSLNDLAKPIDKNLINKLVEKGWKIDIAKPGSDDWKWLNMNGADASFNSGVAKHILLKEGAPKSALLEEFLHGTQTNLGLLEKYGTPQALEVHVKDFMLRHVKLLGLNNPHDIRLLQQLKVEEINRLKDLKL